MGQQFNFNYKKYEARTLSVTQLDGIANIILESGGGAFNNIIAGLKLVCIFLWLYARYRLIEQEQLIAKQQFITEQNERDLEDVEDPFNKE